MNVATGLALGLLVLAGALCLARLARGPSLADRVVALDTFLVVLVTGIAVGALRTGSEAFINVLVIIALLGFVGTVTVARFMERRGA